MNVVQEMAIAANIPIPAVYIIDDSARMRSRPGAIRTPRWRSRRFFREARPRGAAGRHRPRAVARPELRHPLHADRRRHDRRDRNPRRLLPALHVLGRGAPQQQPRGWWCRPGDHLRHRDRARHPGADHRPVHRAGRQPPARVPGRRVSRRADAEPVRAGTGACQDLGRPGILEVANRGTMHMYFTNPIKKFEERSSNLFRPIPRSSTGSIDCASSPGRRRCRLRRPRRWPGWSRGTGPPAAAVARPWPNSHPGT